MWAAGKRLRCTMALRRVGGYAGRGYTAPALPKGVSVWIVAISPIVATFWRAWKGNACGEVQGLLAVRSGGAG